jgi:tetratricopeptide (TPR) repeat protein
MATTPFPPAAAGMVQLGCPLCNTAFPVPGIPGKVYDCPSCGKSLKIPEVIPPKGFEPRKEKGNTKRSRQHRKISLPISVAILMTLILFGFIGAAWWFTARNPSPLQSYSTVLPADAVTIYHANLATLRKNPAYQKDMTALDKALREEFQDLRVQPSATPVVSLFASTTKSAEQLLVFTFAEPIQFAKALTGGRYRQMTQGPLTYHQDRLQETICWAVDEHGRLLGGSLEQIAAALTRAQTEQSAPIDSKFERFVRDVPGGALAWGAVNVDRLLKNSQFDGLQWNLVLERQELQVNATAFFRSPDNQLFLRNSEELDDLIAILGDGKPALLDWKDIGDLLRKGKADSRNSEVRDSEVTFHVAQDQNLLQTRLQANADVFAKQRNDSWLRIKNAYQLAMDQGDLALTKGEFDLATQSFKKALEFYPDGAEAREKYKSAQADEQQLSVFFKALADFDEAHKSKNLGRMKAQLEEARRYLPKDQRVLDRADRLSLEERQAQFDLQRKKADEALASMNLATALESLDAALAIQPKDTEADRLKTSLQLAIKAKKDLTKSQEALAANDVDEALRNIDDAQLALRTLTNPIPSDNRLKRFVDRMVANTCDCYRDIIRTARTASSDHQDKGDRSWQNMDYAASKQEYTHAIAELKKGKDCLEKMKVLSPTTDKFLEETNSKFDQEIARLEELNHRSLGMSHLQKGRRLVAEGKKRLSKGDLNAVLVQAVAKDFQEAQSEFRLAQGFQDIDVDADAREAERQLARANTMVRPFDLNMDDKKLPPDNWDYDRKKWSVVAKDGKARLQTTVSSAILTAPKDYFPTDFDLQVTAGLLDKKGDLRNNWEYYPDLLKVVLVGKSKGDADFTITLGQDPRNKLQGSAALTAGTTSHGIGFIIGLKKPVTIRMVRVAGGANIYLNEKQLAAIPLNQEFREISIHINKKVDASPVLFGASLTMHGG